MSLLINNVTLVLPDGEMKDGEILVNRGIIAGIGSQGSFSGVKIDGAGGFLLPGFIDLHVHGAMGSHFIDGNGADRILSFHLSGGTTGLLASTFSGDSSQWETAAREAQTRDPSLPRVWGLHLEGPLINPVKAGIHAIEGLGAAQKDEVKRFIDSHPGLVRLVTLAPELSGMDRFIFWASSRGIVLSAGHSAASQQEMAAAVEWGVSRLTHLFNAMPSFHHREPGMVGESLLNKRLTVEVIADGIHLDPVVIQLILAVKGYQKINLITDAIAPAGLTEKNNFYLQGKKIRYSKEGVFDQQGTLAGSTLTMIQAVRNMVSFTGCPLWQAVYMASVVPAQTLGIFGETGAIEPGKKADLVLTDAQLNVQRVWIDGEEVFQAG